MKKFFTILLFFLFNGLILHAQEENGNNDKIRDKMTEFVQRRLNLSRSEAEKFSPVFLRYFNEWRNTLREFRGSDDPLKLQQRIVDLRLRYRDEFKEIIGEKRSNDVYKEQERFIEGVKRLREDQRIESRARRFRSPMQ